jgi:hypothetical protein
MEIVGSFQLLIQNFVEVNTETESSDSRRLGKQKKACDSRTAGDGRTSSIHSSNEHFTCLGYLPVSALGFRSILVGGGC